MKDGNSLVPVNKLWSMLHNFTTTGAAADENALSSKQPSVPFGVGSLLSETE
jgi:hypothetical protein